jgi:hypothetical protein
MRLMGFPLWCKDFCCGPCAVEGGASNILTELDEGTSGAPALSRTVSADGDQVPRAQGESAATLSF